MLAHRGELRRSCLDLRQSFVPRFASVVPFATLGNPPPRSQPSLRSVVRVVLHRRIIDGQSPGSGRIIPALPRVGPLVVSWQTVRSLPCNRALRHGPIPSILLFYPSRPSSHSFCFPRGRQVHGVSAQPQYKGERTTSSIRTLLSSPM